MKNTQTTNTNAATNISNIIASVFNEYDALTINDLHITYNHTGKMHGMISVSTTAHANDNCNTYCQVPGSVCSKCYARKQLSRYKNQDICLFKNAHILTRKVYPVAEMPFINAAFFRFESFGDLINEIQFENYLNIAHRNPHTTFAIWTKNPDIMAQVFKTQEKPENLIIIYSSLMVNGDRMSLEDIQSKYTFVDKMFTVYDKKTIKEQNININCGARSCIGCLRCYKKDTENVINEQLK